jgi:hypothetical protein
MTKYSPGTYIYDFHGNEILIGSRVIFSDPSSCAKDDTPLKEGKLVSILYVGYNFRKAKWKIGIEVPDYKWDGKKWVPSKRIIEVRNPKRIIGLDRQEK